MRIFCVKMWMKNFLNEQRRSKLADYMLNLSVASLAVAAFGDKSWGIVPAFICLIVFFILTRE
jgi:uncharacterized membrane protein YcaP (DUF421 family)